MLPATTPHSGSPARRPRWAPAALPPLSLAARAFLREAFGSAAPSRPTQDRLLEHMRCHGLDKGPVAGVPAGEAPSWWLVLEGRIAVGRPGANGDTVENRMLQPGQWFDLASAWLGAEWLESAVCLAPVTLAALPLSTLLACARTDEQLMLGMGQAMAERVRQLTEGRHELATKDVLSRL
ncbi:MAG: Crp/Fnr family transcriptional regulator, partial [Comamonadaceae bacterium]